jgi:hypothetical protein
MIVDAPPNPVIPGLAVLLVVLPVPWTALVDKVSAKVCRDVVVLIWIDVI